MTSGSQEPRIGLHENMLTRTEAVEYPMIKAKAVQIRIRADFMGNIRR